MDSKVTQDEPLDVSIQMDVYGKEKRSAVMASVRSKNTAPERIVWSGLHLLGYRFRLHSKGLPGRPDIALRKYKTVVFVHGCFWHRHTLCGQTRVPMHNTSFWQEKFAKTVARDRENYQKLAALDWNVIVVWECAIKRKEYQWLVELSNILQDILASGLMGKMQLSKTIDPYFHEIVL